MFMFSCSLCMRLICFLSVFGFCKYNQIDKHLWDRTLQYIISGELKVGWLLRYNEALSNEKTLFEK
jgi:hypothetical protein